jgi:hypothetical protein
MNIVTFSCRKNKDKEDQASNGKQYHETAMENSQNKSNLIYHHFLV